MSMPDSQRYPGNLYMIKNVEDIVVSRSLKVFNSNNANMFSCSRNAQVTFVENPKLKIISSQNYKH